MSHPTCRRLHCSAGFAASFAVISLLFAMMFKWLPDTKVEWRDVWLGAVLTAALFEVEISHRPLHRQAGPRIDLWGRSLDHRGAHLGLLLRPARPDGRRIHECVCPPLRLAETCSVRRPSGVATETCR